MATHKGATFLTGIAMLTPEGAEALAKHESDLFLEGLTEISPEAAATLQGNRIF